MVRLVEHVSKRKGEAEVKGQRSTNEVKVNVEASARAKKTCHGNFHFPIFLPSSIDILWPFPTSASVGH